MKSDAGNKMDWDELRQRLRAAVDSLGPSSHSDTEKSDLILKRRAEQLAQVPAETVLASEVLEIISFELGEERYAIETRYVHEVIRPDEITPIPSTTASLLGVTNLRGEVLAVFDLGHFLDCPVAQSAVMSVLILGNERPEFGIATDSIDEVSMLHVDDVLHNEGVTAETHSELVRGVTNDALILIDGLAVLNDDRLHIDDA